MRRITYWVLSTVSALVLLFGYHTSTSSTAVVSAEHSTPVPTAGTSSSPSNSSASTPGAASVPSAASTGGMPSSASTTTSTVTGEAAQTRYGPVQVQLTVSGGEVTAVTVVQHPDGDGRDQEINAQALPILVRETLKAQSAQIDMVSGATCTSTGYTTSLQSALDEAGL